MRITVEHHEGDTCDDCLAAVAGTAFALEVDPQALAKAVGAKEDGPVREQLTGTLKSLLDDALAGYQKDVLTPLTARLRGAHVLDADTAHSHRG